MEKFLNFCGDGFVEASSKKLLKVSKAWQPDQTYAVAHSEAMDVVHALQLAKKAQVLFEKWSPEKRAESLLSVAWGLEHRADIWAELEAECSGLPYAFVKEHSILAAARMFRRQAALLQSGSGSFAEQYSPIGLVSIVTPWTLGTRVVAESLAPALAAGNGAVIKVSSLNPATVKILGELLAESGLPAGLVNILLGTGLEVGQLLISHPSFRSVSFAGSLKKGFSAAQNCIQLGKVFHIENSSKNSLVLLDGWQNMELETVLESALWGMGQTGWNTNRIFILESQAEEFREKLINWLSRQSLATQAKDPSWWTPLRQGEVSQKRMLELVHGLKAEHGHIAGVADERAPAFVFDLPNCSIFQQDNMNLPVFVVNSVKYIHEVAKWIGNGDTGYKAVLRGAPEKCLRLAEKLPVGSVEVNSWLSPEADFHYGIKGSFLGTRGRDFISPRFSYVKNVTLHY